VYEHTATYLSGHLGSRQPDFLVRDPGELHRQPPRSRRRRPRRLGNLRPHV